jgi:hypothetical protein
VLQLATAWQDNHVCVDVDQANQARLIFGMVSFVIFTSKPVPNL